LFLILSVHLEPSPAVNSCCIINAHRSCIFAYVSLCYRMYFSSFAALVPAM